jgi:hypothetical protein
LPDPFEAEISLTINHRLSCDRMIEEVDLKKASSFSYAPLLRDVSERTPANA